VHFCIICLENSISRHPQPNSMLFIMIKLSFLIYNIVRKKGIHYSFFVPKIACKHIFLLSVPGMPRNSRINMTMVVYIHLLEDWLSFTPEQLKRCMESNPK